jgi:hypothetical protein
VLALESIATGNVTALENAVVGHPRCAATNMDGNVFILMAILLRLHIAKSDCWYFQNLRRTSTLLDDALVFSAGGSDAVKVGSTLSTSAYGASEGDSKRGEMRARWRLFGNGCAEVFFSLALS